MSNISSAEIEAFNKKMAESRTPGERFPSAIKLGVSSDGTSVSAELEDATKENLRQLDPWTLAFVIEAEKNLIKEKIKIINFKVKTNTIDKYFKLYFEAFKRRVSFLEMNNSVNSLKCSIFLDGNPVELYTEQELFNRPQNEIVRPIKVKERQDNTPDISLEKDLQTFLYGKTNKRLALLGEHFIDKNIAKKQIPIFREYPTGVFNGKASDENRILPTDSVDFVSLNNKNHLSVIELKTNDNAPLELISQILDYALFFACYKEQLLNTKPLKPFVQFIKEEKIACYAIANKFDLRFDSIFMQYYKTSDKYGFEIYKVLMGCTI